MGGAPRKVEARYGPSSYRAQCALPRTEFAELEPLCRPKADATGGAPSKVEARYGPSSYRAQCALPCTEFAELEPLCRPKADAMGGAPSKVGGPANSQARLQSN